MKIKPEPIFRYLLGSKITSLVDLVDLLLWNFFELKNPPLCTLIQHSQIPTKQYNYGIHYLDEKPAHALVCYVGGSHSSGTESLRTQERRARRLLELELMVPSELGVSGLHVMIDLFRLFAFTTPKDDEEDNPQWKQKKQFPLCLEGDLVYNFQT